MRKRQFPRNKVTEIDEFESFNSHLERSLFVVGTHGHDDADKAFAGFKGDGAEAVVEFEASAAEIFDV